MIRIWHQLETWLISFLMALLTALVFMEALFRKLGISALWLSESINWAAAWFVLFGMAYGVRTGSHIGLTILTDQIRNLKLKRFLAFIAVAVCLAYCAILFASAWVYIQKQQFIGFVLMDVYIPEALIGDFPAEEIRVQLWVLYCGLLVGFGLLFWRFLVLAYGIATGQLNGLKFVDEAKEAVEQFGQEGEQS